MIQKFKIETGLHVKTKAIDQDQSDDMPEDSESSDQEI